ncbi:uncharacterized protein LOC134564521 [Prinia subflava]|uniref:uncharacterized protein LOC134564521 n=1 Tax=Prinia subflava TaxID=208062 RepID=UPI002FE140BE
MFTVLRTKFVIIRGHRDAEAKLQSSYQTRNAVKPEFQSDLNPACLSYPKKQRPHPAARLDDDTSLHWKEAEKPKFTFAPGSQPRLEVRAWRGQGAALRVSGTADRPDTAACGASPIRQGRPSCQRDAGAAPSCRPPTAVEGLWRSITQTCRLSRTQPPSRGARQGQAGSERCREREREAKGRARGTGRRWTPPAAGKGLALPPAAERRALTARYRRPARRPGLAIVARRKRRCSLGAPESRASSGSAGPPSLRARRGGTGRGGGDGDTARLCVGSNSVPGRKPRCQVDHGAAAVPNMKMFLNPALPPSSIKLLSGCRLKMFRIILTVEIPGAHLAPQATSCVLNEVREKSQTL